MEQDQIQIPRITHGRSYPWYYVLYLQIGSWVMRQLVHQLSGNGRRFSQRITVASPGLGHGSVACSVCLPRGDYQEPLPVVIVMEGGGFVLGEPNDGEQQSRMISDQAKAVVISVDYAKAPRFPYPHALLQVYEVLRWALSPEAKKKLGADIDPTRVAVMGNSAGGNLAASLSLLCAFTSGPCAVFRQGLPATFRQVAQILLYPSVALNDRYGARYMSSERRVQELSLPVWVAEMMEAAYLPPYINKEQIFIAPLSAEADLLRSIAPQLPPTLFALAGLDCLKLEAHAYAEKLSDADVHVTVKEFEGANHGFTHYKPGNKGYQKNNVEEAWELVSGFLIKGFRR
ncbi:hypothetical protein JX265_013296 [Neoarthrinium moseri]|uniref:Alpha/beta hydrolase fold-3 domain-containing protein n=1 Tax=Neoarthrinium moseri TaxID=1658444 RepID=A0A9P9W8I9_9PEZI|nr:uncharacterized protein JN550_013336 [Neoarthrinium moseri]KAI1843414.1 hypothetical protein JX266_010411 [Neoarthrinium moseri]KAI1850816.1 hypothetical protein JX265_013296 [Neoarthrinium moseri]KAI1857253.1 hypothetical protein JN550_013336 [Neoarthrinium moseri]